VCVCVCVVAEEGDGAERGREGGGGKVRGQATWASNVDNEYILYKEHIL
jgi:hypothetical protein